MQSFRAWFQGGSRVLALVKSPAVGAKGNNVPIAKVQVPGSAGMQVSRPGSGVGPGCWLELRVWLRSLKEAALQLPRCRVPGLQRCRFPGLVPGWVQGVGCS